MRLYGVPVSEEDCRAFVTSLMIVDSDAALDAARTIAHGLDLEAQLIALTPEQRDAILAVPRGRPTSPGARRAARRAHARPARPRRVAGRAASAYDPRMVIELDLPEEAAPNASRRIATYGGSPSFVVPQSRRVGATKSVTVTSSPSYSYKIPDQNVSPVCRNSIASSIAADKLLPSQSTQLGGASLAEAGKSMSTPSTRLYSTPARSRTCFVSPTVRPV